MSRTAYSKPTPAYQPHAKRGMVERSAGQIDEGLGVDISLCVAALAIHMKRFQA